MIETLTAKLLEIFQAMAGDTDATPFSEVFDYITEGTGSFPFLCFEIDEMKPKVLTTGENLRTYIFTVCIAQEINQAGGRSEARQMLSKAIDLVINTLDRNYTLDGLCEGGTEPAGFTIATVTLGNGSALVADLKFECKTIYDINY